MSWIPTQALEDEDRLGRDAAAQVLRRAWGLLAPHRRRAWLAVIVLVLSTAATLAGPALVRHGDRPFDVDQPVDVVPVVADDGEA